MGICKVNKLVIGNKNTEKGSIQIYGKDIDVLKLGDATHEGGDISVYRDTSGNKQFFVDADAASNATAMDVYGGVIAQHLLTVGTAVLNTSNKLYVNGNAYITSTLAAPYGLQFVDAGSGMTGQSNKASLIINMPVSGTDAIDHAVKLQIDANDIIVAQATGNGSGGIKDLKALFYAPTFHADTPQTLTGAGAVNITTSITHLVTTAADALTLADGATGQIKYIVMKTHGGNGTLTPAHFANGTTLTFDAVGDSVMLLFTNGSWHWTGGTATIGA